MTSNGHFSDIAGVSVCGNDRSKWMCAPNIVGDCWQRLHMFAGPVSVLQTAIVDHQILSVFARVFRCSESVCDHAKSMDLCE